MLNLIKAQTENMTNPERGWFYVELNKAQTENMTNPERGWFYVELDKSPNRKHDKS